MDKALTFGWMSNPAADGFEQEHGDFSVEVYWDEANHVWHWIVWGPGVTMPEVVQRGTQEQLSDAKKESLARVARLEEKRLVVKK